MPGTPHQFNSLGRTSAMLVGAVPLTGRRATTGAMHPADEVTIYGRSFAVLAGTFRPRPTSWRCV